MLNRFVYFFDQYGLKKDASFLLAVSGGVDSVVLTHLFHFAGMEYSLAHCNFGLRGEESDGDEEFVRSLARRLDAPCHVRNFDPGDGRGGQSTQMLARELRYDWFYSLCLEFGYDYVVTAHHQDDSVETMLYNLIKGTGISGMRGILPVRNSLVRPLIHCTKSEIIDYAVDQKITWREDSSNERDDYTRNRIRNLVIPALQEINPSFLRTSGNTLNRMRGVEELYHDRLESLREKLISAEGEDYLIRKKQLMARPAPGILFYELVKPFGFNYDQAMTIMKDENPRSGKQFLSRDWVLTVDRKEWILSKRVEENRAEVKIRKSEKTAEFDRGTISFQKVRDFEKSQDTTRVFVDADRLEWPLVIRPWRQGDRFHPLGMKGKKKLSDFMIDRKIPLNLKERVRVLCTGNDIVWVIGQRLDHRFRVTDKTQHILKIELA